MSALLTLALYLGPRFGRGVFPLEPRSKLPAGWVKGAEHGCLSASKDPGQIRKWFETRPYLNLGLALGDGDAALDVDPRNDGDATLAKLEAAHGTIPHTVRTVTGRGDGGTHHLFTHNPALILKNGPIADGIDLKTRGGYIVVPPSVHPDTGRPYRFDLGALPSATPLAQLPAWIATLASDRPKGTSLPSSGIDARESVLGQIFEQLGWLGDALPDGRRIARCPWFRSHTDDRGNGRDTSCVIFPRSDGAVLGVFKCSHSHCSGRNWRDVFDLVGPEVRNAASLALASKLRAA